MCISARGDTLDDAVRALSTKISIAPGETPHVTVRNLSSLTESDASNARDMLEKTLRSGGTHIVEVQLTIAENVSGFLVVAELRRGDQPVVEMVSWRPDEVRAQPRISLARRLVWEQDSAMTDVAVAGDRLLILEPDAIVAYTRGAAGWERPESRRIEPAQELRDPRGRLQLSDNGFAAFLPGTTCHGAWATALDVKCEASAAQFTTAGTQVRFTPGRNTMDADGQPPFYSLAQVEERGRTFYLAAEPDDRAHIFDRDHKPAGEIDGWGDEIAAIEHACGGAAVLATSAAERGSTDSVTAFAIRDRRPVQLSDPADLPGPVLALWAADQGALAIVRNSASGTYAAYSISLDCGR